MTQSEVRRKANDTQKTQWREEHCAVGSGASHAETGLGVLCKPRIPRMTVTVWYYILQWHQGSYKLKFLLENHLGMDSSIERAWGHLQTSCSNGKGSNLCWVQLFREKKNTNKKTILHKPASTWNHSFVVSTNSNCVLLQGNIIFNVLLLLKRSGLRSEQERRPETSFEKMLI